MSGPARPSRGVRGQPLVVLVVLLGGWIAMRAALWQSPFPPPAGARLLGGVAHGLARVGTAAPRPASGAHRADLRLPWTPRAVVPGAHDAPDAAPLPPPWQATAPAVAPPLQPPQAAAEGPPPETRIVGQQLLLVAAFSHIQLPPEIAAYFARPRPAGASPLAAPLPPAGRPPAPAAGAFRWSADGWLLLRRDSAGPLAAGEPSYGRSQAGGVLRYRLAPASGHRPVAYARATRALAGPRETEVAIGLAARPIPGVPVSVAGEVRVYEGLAGREVRPAAFAVTELPPAKLPLGLRGEAYAQAGYVGGRFATAFVDGQARVDGKLARLGPTGEVRVGGGVWGGAQKHAARLDVGPGATVSFRLGRTQARLALDYRWRVAGDAAPNNGPALTISAGF
jgi:hypothetical protein